jgi:hypothetical protein
MRFVEVATLVLVSLAAGATTTSARASNRGPVEFCAATASVAFPIGAAFGTPSRTFGYDLTALTPRTVSATLVADTTAGWYSWTAGNVALANTQRAAHIRTLPREFHLMPHETAASPTLAVTFPVPLAIRHLWVTSAQGAACEVPAFDAPSDTVAPDPADIAPSPSPLYAASVAAPAKPPFASSGCDAPFVAGTVTKPEAPEYPLSLREMDSGPLAGAVEVALDPEGNLIGAWIYAGSGFAAWDRAALQAAAKSKYRGSISYCRPVKGTYLFLATAMPGG